MATPPHSTTYRPDIDGLRAVAVLSVVLYHAFPEWRRGGFIGVDIFFVISGYLISTIIFDAVALGRFSYLDFYERRIKRIFPALILVLLACLCFAAAESYPKEARQLGKHVVAGALFASNFVLWREAGYFDSASELKPLLHLWSLSVEEQYYIVWPLLVGALYKRSRWLIAATLLLLAASFGLNVLLVSRDPVATFYMPATRIWELMIGSVLAYATRFGGGLPALLSGWMTKLGGRASAPAPGATSPWENVLGWTGAVLVAAALVLITPQSAFPGWWALLPTLGAFCLIGAGPNAWFNKQVLGSGVAVFFGKISYPLYLWHWPLLAFPKIVDGELSHGEAVAAVFASIALAWLTYQYVEKPVRFGRRISRTPLVLAGAVGCLAVAGGLLFASDGWVNRYPVQLRQIAVVEFKFDTSAYRGHRCFLLPDQASTAFAAECQAGARAGVPKVWLWGDSHAAALYPGLNAQRTGEQPFDLTQFNAGWCPPVMDFEPPQNPHCKAINDAVMQKIEAQRPEVVLLAANWVVYRGAGDQRGLDMRELERTVERLRSQGVQRVVVIGQFPHSVVSQPVLILDEWRRSHVIAERSDRFLIPPARDVDGLVRAAAVRAGASFLSPMESLCNASGCLLTIASGGERFPVAWDDAHLTTQASELLVSRWRPELLGAFGGKTPASGR